MARAILARTPAARWPPPDINASGADPAGGIGELRDNETHRIPRAMMALQGHVDFAVFGDDHDTPEGTAIRDDVHVTDLAAAHVAALKPLETGDASDPTYLVADASAAARKVLNFVPRHSDLATVIRTAWASHQKAHPLRSR